MSLIERFSALLERSVQQTFAQERTQQRAEELMLGGLCAFGRRTVSRSICAVGRQDRDWSADYKVYSRSPWESDDLFQPVLEEYRQMFRMGPIVAAMDDTKYAKTGLEVPGASWHRDPLSPPFHTNLIYGQRFVQVSLIFPLYRREEQAPRAIPVRFVESAVVKKPGKRASDEDWKVYRQARRQKNLSTDGVAILRSLRAALDAMGCADRLLVATVDGSWCNRTVFRADLERIVVVARGRKDAAPRRQGRAGPTTPKSSPPNRSATMKPLRGTKPASSTAALGARFATRNCPRSCGAGARGSGGCVCWSWPRNPIDARPTGAGNIMRRPTC